MDSGEKRTVVPSLILLLMAMALISSCTIPHLSVFEERRKDEKQRIDTEIELKRSDPSVYFGEGVTGMGDDMGKAIEEAKNRALADLSGKIWIKVETDIKSILGYRESVSEKGNNEILESKFDKIVKTYTNTVINDYDSEKFMNYPEKGQITFIVWISREKYDANVRDALQMKKKVVVQKVGDARRACSEKNYTLGIRYYLDALGLLNAMMSGFPLFDDLDGDGVPEDFNTFVTTSVTSIFEKIRIMTDEPVLRYDASGTVSGKPILYAQYTGEGGPVPVSNLPLEAEFVLGKGMLPTGLVTGAHGELQLTVEHVDPEFPKAQIRVGIYAEGIQGLSAVESSPPAFCIIDLEKIPSMVIVATFRNAGKFYELQDIRSGMKAAVSRAGFHIIDMTTGENPSVNALWKNARSRHADYVMMVMARAGTARKMGEYDLLQTDCTCEIQVYDAETGSVVISAVVPAVKGYGTTGVAAGWDALGKMGNTITKETAELAESLGGEVK